MRRKQIVHERFHNILVFVKTARVSFIDKVNLNAHAHNEVDFHWFVPVSCFESTCVKEKKKNKFMD